MPSTATGSLNARVLPGTDTVALDTKTFEAGFNMALVHETVRAEQAARRQGTHSTKTRGNVRGGGAKPWKQKGTGRARAGSSRNPIWTGGGTAFGPLPRHYTFKINRKARRVALRSALSVHAERGSLAVFDAGAFSAPSTKQALELLTGWGADARTLVVLAESERDAGLSFRNLERVVALPAEDAGVVNIIGAARLLISEAALPLLVARANGTTSEEGDK
jgi:large subunit ribosomal protein L4